MPCRQNSGRQIRRSGAPHCAYAQTAPSISSTTRSRLRSSAARSARAAEGGLDPDDGVTVERGLHRATIQPAGATPARHDRRVRRHSACRPTGDAMTTTSLSLRSHPAFSALTAHHAEIADAAPARSLRRPTRPRHASDRRRRPASTSTTPRTASPTRRSRLLLQLAEERASRERHRRDVRGERINVTENRAVLHVALRAPRDALIEVDGRTWSRGARRARPDGGVRRPRARRASGRAHRQARSATSSTSASAAPTSAR